MAFVFSEDIIPTTYSDQQLSSKKNKAYEDNMRFKLIQSKCRQFIRDWRYEETFIYREQIKAHYRSGHFELQVDFTDIISFDKELSDQISETPNEIIPILEYAALEIVAETMIPKPIKSEMKPIQITLKNYNRQEKIRSIRSKHISKLISVTGIIVSSYRVKSKAKKIKIRCITCNDTRTIECKRGFNNVAIPRLCASKTEGSVDNICEIDPFIIVPDTSEFIDYQKLRLQELPIDVPTGEIPCHIPLYVDRYLVNKVKPGSKVNVIGVFSVYQNTSKLKNRTANLKIPYIQVVGIESTSSSNLTDIEHFSLEDEQKFKELSKDPNLYEKLAQSLAPKIYGHEDIKKAIICLLFSGTSKELPSRTRIRGDINVLLLGDPSVAKSQLLKCTEKSAPICIYTSGKGCSAAGLTAAVIKDNFGDFYLEGGAMVLADGGCVCIDEFDKMREDDRVAIHESMEQQTISIAKAGITTVLNTRTSVLAAANPTFGRYNDLKKTVENIDFETTILSRFDLIFVIKDKQDYKRDKLLSSHIIDIHMQKDIEENSPSIDPIFFRRYIAYCKKTCHPHISDKAAAKLKNRYISFRNEAKINQEQGMGSIPITVRQLEAIIRIAEARAKLELSEVATVAHVNESIRLFKLSTMSAVSSSNDEAVIYDINDVKSDFRKSVQRAERHLRRRLPIGTRWSYARLIRELVIRNHPESAVRKGVSNMINRGELESVSRGKVVVRKH